MAPGMGEGEGEREDDRHSHDTTPTPHAILNTQYAHLMLRAAPDDIVGMRPAPCPWRVVVESTDVRAGEGE